MGLVVMLDRATYSIKHSFLQERACSAPSYFLFIETGNQSTCGNLIWPSLWLLKQLFTSSMSDTLPIPIKFQCACGCFISLGHGLLSLQQQHLPLPLHVTNRSFNTSIFHRCHFQALWRTCAHNCKIIELCAVSTDSASKKIYIVTPHTPNL